MTTEALNKRLKAASVFDEFLSFGVDMDLLQVEDAIRYIEENNL